VLARNIAVRRKPSRRSVDLGFLPTKRARARRPVTRAYPTSTLLARVNARRSVVARAATPTGARDHRVGTRDHRTGASLPAVRDHRESGLGGRPVRVVGVAAAVARPELSTARRAKTVPLQRAVRRVPGVRARVKTVPSAPQPSTDKSTTRSDPNDIYIIAFVCRLLPKAPDPDPSFSW
jgi:hypothetical protein